MSNFSLQSYRPASSTKHTLRDESYKLRRGRCRLPADLSRFSESVPVVYTCLCTDLDLSSAYIYIRYSDESELATLAIVIGFVILKVIGICCCCCIRSYHLDQNEAKRFRRFLFSILIIYCAPWSYGEVTFGVVPPYTGNGQGWGKRVLEYNGHACLSRGQTKGRREDQRDPGYGS